MRGATADFNKTTAGFKPRDFRPSACSVPIISTPMPPQDCKTCLLTVKEPERELCRYSTRVERRKRAEIPITGDGSSFGH